MAFILSKCKNSGVQIIDTSEYLSQSVLTVQGDAWYTYAESFTVNVLYKVDLNKNTTLIDYAIEEHTFSEDNIEIPNKSILEFKQDGLHQITQLIIPNKEWLETNKQFLNQYFENIYYCDGINIYDINDNIVDIKDLVIDCSNILNKSKYTFTLDKILQRFKEESIKVLTDKAKPLVRNVLWIGIDVVKYCLSQGWYFEAERRLQQVINCINSSNANQLPPNLMHCGCLKTQWMNNGPKSLH